MKYTIAILVVVLAACKKEEVKSSEGNITFYQTSNKPVTVYINGVNVGKIYARQFKPECGASAQDTLINLKLIYGKHEGQAIDSSGTISSKFSFTISKDCAVYKVL